MLATPNSWRTSSSTPVNLLPALLHRSLFVWFCSLALLQLAGFIPTATAQESTESASKSKFSKILETAYLEAKSAHEQNSNSAEAQWKFAQACFDWADFNSSSSIKESVAEEGAKATRMLIKTNSSSAEGHYYLAMNLGEIAETKSLGALRLVSQMETEFKTALTLKPDLDFSGPDRNLGMLYLEAPGWPASVGNRSKAKHHFLECVKRSPNYPENLLDLIEADLKWNDKASALKILEDLDTLWPKALNDLSGLHWEPSWDDWTNRREVARQKLSSKPKQTNPSHGTSNR